MLDNIKPKVVTSQKARTGTKVNNKVQLISETFPSFVLDNEPLSEAVLVVNPQHYIGILEAPEGV